MIGRLRGELLDIEGSLAVVDAGGVGYEVSLPHSVLLQLPPAGELIELYTRQIVREDGVTLYGFIESGERRLFDLLLTVNGCGPKAALALLGQVGTSGVESAILTQDARSLTRASGVGPKLAERIILELKEKVQEDSLVRKAGAAASRSRSSDEVVEALMGLGYRRSEAEGAAADAASAAESVQDRLRHALRILKK